MEQGTMRVAGVVGIAAALVVGGVALGLAASNQAATAASASPACASSTPKLTVQGTGSASASPDVLTVAVDIDVTDPNAQASLVDDNSKAAAVIAALKGGGVTSKDIQTSNVTIQPNYSLTGTITGYQMTNTLTAQLRNFSTAGSVIDAVTAAAGNAARIDSLTFSLQDPRQIEDRARNDAVRQAVSHARSMAGAAGERLGPVCSLTDDSSPYYGVASSLPSASAALPNAATVPLQAGTQQESAQITLVYALVPARRGA
ncbi:MAG TPA: SIMPL domain-containing protein [Acidimicrobiales bacterium]|nr:SIMPL domain-containing protein [Acidimicrobiales bacterium]